MIHIARDGSLWHIYCDPPPIPSRAHDWTWYNDDYDGAPDAHDYRHGTAPTREACIEQIEDMAAELRREHLDELAQELCSLRQRIDQGDATELDERLWWDTHRLELSDAESLEVMLDSDDYEPCAMCGCRRTEWIRTVRGGRTFCDTGCADEFDAQGVRTTQ